MIPGKHLRLAGNLRSDQPAEGHRRATGIEDGAVLQGSQPGRPTAEQATQGLWDPDDVTEIRAGSRYDGDVQCGQPGNGSTTE